MKLKIALLLLVIGGTVADAATITWTNTAGGNWSAAANWSPNQAPGSSDDAVITASGTYNVTLDTSPTINSLTLGGSSGQQMLNTSNNNLTLNNASVVNVNGNLAMTGGNLSGAGLLTVNGQLNWTNGSITSSALMVATNGLLVLAGGNLHDSYGSLTNAGTIQLVSGDLRLRAINCGGAGQLINLPGALIDIQSDTTIEDACGGALLVNYGTVRKSGGSGTSGINPLLSMGATGTLDVQTGTVNINGNDTPNSTGVFQTETGATLNFPNNFTAYSGVQFNGVGTNLIINGNNGSTFTINGFVTISNLTLVGGTLVGTNGIIAGVLPWISGSFGQGSTLTIATNGLLVLAGGNLHDSYGSLTNAGTIQLVSGDLRLRAINCGGAGQLINLPGALIDIQSDTTIEDACGGALLVNYGTVRKSGGSGTSGINPLLSMGATGTLDVQTGTVNINGNDTPNSTGVFQTETGATLNFPNNFTAYSGVQFNGVGTNLIINGNNGSTFTINGFVTISNLTLVGGTLVGTNGIIAGVLPWISGSFGQGSTLTIATNGLLVLAGGNLHDSYGSLTNAGTIQLVSGDLRLRAINCGGAGQLINLPGALIDIQSDTTIEDACGGALLVNYGTVRKSGGSGTSGINPLLSMGATGTLDVQTGTVNINGNDTPNSTGVFQTETGATLNFPNNFTAYSGVQFNGVGTNEITAGAFALNGLVTISNLTLAGASLVGNNGVIAGFLNWVSGSVGSGVAVGTNGLLVLAGNNGTDYQTQGVLTNAGTVRLLSGNLQLACSPGQLINLPGALVDLTEDVSIDQRCGGELLVNYGTLRKSGGTGTSAVNAPFNNYGLLDVQTGTVNLNSAGDTGNSTGVFQSETGATLNFANNFTAYSGVQFTGVGTNEITAGAFALNGLVTISNLTLAGASLVGNNGVIAGFLNWVSGSVGSGVAVGTNGLLVLAGVNGNDYQLVGALTNAGIVRLVSGNFQINNCAGGLLVNSLGALVDITSDVSIDTRCGGELLINYGTVRKSGGIGTSTIHPTFNNNGTLDVQTGTVSLQGSYTLTGGTLNYGINSLTSYGKIILSGSPAMLDGSVSANLNNGYVPVTNNSFALLTYSSYTGMFTNTALPAVAFWQTNYGPTSFTITVLQVNGLAFTTQPVGGVLTNKIIAPVVVQVENGGGNPIATNGVPVTLSLNSGSGTLNGTLTQNTDPTGKATFSDLSFSQIGTKTLLASNPTLASATSTPFGIFPLFYVQWTGTGLELGLYGTNSLGSTTIFASTNLTFWTPIYTNAATNGPIIFFDPASLNIPHRFYRFLQE